MVNNVVYSNIAEMAPATIHLKVADEIAKELGINVSGQYLLGAIAPDAVYARVDYTKEDVLDSHYRQESIKKSWFHAAEEFKQVDNPFLKGYCIHIMTDVLWLSQVIASLKRKYEDAFSKSTLTEDMNYLEKWLYKKNEYLALWNGILGAKINNINYYVSPGEIDLFKSQKSQSIRYDMVAESMQYLTLEDIDKFVKKSVKRILIELNV